MKKGYAFGAGKLFARKDCAFTLIELLVVIVIIAILAALLLPVLARARGKAQATVCLNHVRQWGIAVWMYTEEFYEYFPYEGNPARIDTLKNLQAWYNVLTPYFKQPRLMDLYAKGCPPVPSDRSVFACPKTAKKPPSLLTVKNAFFMYGFNSRLDPNDPDEIGTRWLQFRREQVWQPSSTVTFADNSETNYPTTSGHYTPGRHFGRANLAFVDGHASAVHSNEYFRTLQEERSSTNEWSKPRNIYWFPFPGAPE